MQFYYAWKKSDGSSFNMPEITGMIHLCVEMRHL